ncbi:transcription antitermination factor NusB [Jeotgalicoccus huakuii]|nr:transcription antitermination factor NusB [Jeotgalicoccus huakuii]
MKRHEQRQKAFQLLFQTDKDIVDLTNAKYYEVYQSEMFIKAIVDYYFANGESINGKISSSLTGYTIDRISKVERNILRIAISELEVHDSPVKVVIDEAVRLAKNYGDKDSHRFVNGVLKNFAVQNEG